MRLAHNYMWSHLHTSFLHPSLLQSLESNVSTILFQSCFLIIMKSDIDITFLHLINSNLLTVKMSHFGNMHQNWKCSSFLCHEDSSWSSKWNLICHSNIHVCRHQRNQPCRIRIKLPIYAHLKQYAMMTHAQMSLSCKILPIHEPFQEYFKQAWVHSCA